MFPVGQGSTWEFAGKAGTLPLQMTATITSSTVTGNKRLVRFHWTANGKDAQEEEYIVTSTQISRARSGASGGNTIDPPIPVIKYPLQAGKSWSWKGSIGMGGQSASGKAILRVIGRQSVKTRARTFNAWRVDLKLTVSAQGQTITIPNTYWFAPGAGLIKQSATLPAPGGKSLVTSGEVTKYTIK